MSESSFPEPLQWNGDEPDPNQGGWGLRYRCLQCRWTGRGGAVAVDHHRIAHHRIVLAVVGARICFSCCPDEVLCATCETGPRACQDCDALLCDCAREAHACPEQRCGGCGRRGDCSCDDYEREEDWI